MERRYVWFFLAVHALIAAFAVAGAGVSQGATMFPFFILDLPIVTPLYILFTLSISFLYGFSDLATKMNRELAFVFFPVLGTLQWWYLIGRMTKKPKSK